ncbi:MAG: hypothetical protein Q9200_007443, partial [Gallowayella weberi]
LGRVTHYAFDLVLISAFLAGVRRSTGLTRIPATSPFPPDTVQMLTIPPSWDSQPQLPIGQSLRKQRNKALGRQLSRNGRMDHGPERCSIGILRLLRTQAKEIKQGADDTMSVEGCILARNVAIFGLMSLLIAETHEVSMQHGAGRDVKLVWDGIWTQALNAAMVYGIEGKDSFRGIVLRYPLLVFLPRYGG